MRCSNIPFKKLRFDKYKKLNMKANIKLNCKYSKATKKKAEQVSNSSNTFECDKLLVEHWGKGINSKIPEISIIELFEMQVTKLPDKTALIFENLTLSYEKLNQRANQLAAYLLELGVHQEVPVVIYLERSMDMIVAVIAVLKTGGFYIPIDSSYPKERINQIISDSQAKLVITQVSLQHNLTDLKIDPVTLDNKLRTISSFPTNNPDIKVSSGNLAYAIYTSGSTGVPKGVLIEHRSLVNFIISISNEYEIISDDIIVQFASLSFDVSVFDIFVSLTKGATLCIANEKERKSPKLLTRFLRKYSVTVAELPPAILSLLDSDNFPSLRLISVGGEGFSGDIVTKWRTEYRRFINGYGPTETTVAVTLHDCTEQGSQNPPIGRPLHNVELYVLNSKREPVPVGEIGVLHIGGMCLARGYLNRPDLTEEKFIRNPFSNDPLARLYMSGDLVRWLPGGVLEFMGRIDRQIKIRGFRVELGEIESVILEDPYINQVIIEKYEDAYRDIHLIAYIISSNKNKFNTIELRERLKQRLPKYMVPSNFIQIDEVPLTSNGKINYAALPKPYKNAQARNVTP